MKNWKSFETEEGLPIMVDVSEVVVVETGLWKKTSKPDDERVGVELILKNKSRVDVYGTSYESVAANVRS